MIDIEELLRQRAGQRQPYMPQDDNEPQYANPGPKLRDPIAPAPVPLPPQRGMGPGGFLGIGLSPGPQIGAYPMPPAAPPAPQEDLLGDNGPAKNLGLGQRDALDSLRFGMPGQAIDPMAAAKNLNLAPAPDDRQAAIAAALKGGDGQGFKYVPTGADLAQAKPQAFQTPAGQTVEKLPTPSVNQVMDQTGFGPAQSGFTRNISDPSGITSQENWSVDPNTQSGYRMTGNRQVAPTMTDYRQSFLNDLAKEGMQAGQAETGQSGVPGMAQLTRQMFGVDMSSPSITPAMRQQLLGMQNHLVDQQQNQGLAREHMANTLANTELQNQGLKERLLLGLKGNGGTDTTIKTAQDAENRVQAYILDQKNKTEQTGQPFTLLDREKAERDARRTFGALPNQIAKERIDTIKGEGLVRTPGAGGGQGTGQAPPAANGVPAPASTPAQPAQPAGQDIAANDVLYNMLNRTVPQALALNQQYNNAKQEVSEGTRDSKMAQSEVDMGNFLLQMKDSGIKPTDQKATIEQLLAKGVDPEFLRRSLQMGIMRSAGQAATYASGNDQNVVRSRTPLTMLQDLFGGNSESGSAAGLMLPGTEAYTGTQLDYPRFTGQDEMRKFQGAFLDKAREGLSSMYMSNPQQFNNYKSRADFLNQLYQHARPGAGR